MPLYNSWRARREARNIAFYIRDAAIDNLVFIEVWIESDIDWMTVKKGDLVCPDCYCKKGEEHDECCGLGDAIKELSDGLVIS